MEQKVKIVWCASNFIFQAGLKAGMNEHQIKTCLGKLKDPAVKERLKQYTEEALQHGVSIIQLLPCNSMFHRT